MQIMLQHVNRQLTPPYLVNPKVPGDISEIICRMMAKDPNDRYQDYETLIRDLESAKIHRLAKERRSAATSSEHSVAGAETVILDELSDVGSVASAPGTSTYLHEGIVRIDPKELPDPEPPTSRARSYIWALIGIFILAIAIASAFLPRENAAGRKEPSWLAQRIQVLLNPASQKSESKTIEEIISEDKERIDTTRRRMEGLLYKLLDYKRAHGGELPTVRQLLAKGEAQEEDVTDAWGHRFIVSSEGGGKIISVGRDGIEDTSDDFVMSLMGQPPRIPPPLSQSDAAIFAQQK
jgi:hypothetical protein